MSAITANCAHCGQTVRANGAHSGMRLPCPDCGQPVTFHSEFNSQDNGQSAPRRTLPHRADSGEFISAAGYEQLERRIVFKSAAEIDNAVAINRIGRCFLFGGAASAAAHYLGIGGEHINNLGNIAYPLFGGFSLVGLVFLGWGYYLPTRGIRPLKLLMILLIVVAGFSVLYMAVILLGAAILLK